ncbi:MAG: GNAT family N-acetyltransferase [Dehalococcoidia bacterium]|nr:GNAT family N-acetyltransferase [Dehalococcoidia bacterium]
MEITICTKEDFDQILTDFGQFWEHERTLALHHPTLLYEFGNSAFVIRHDNKVVAYLFGFISQTEPEGYINLLAVRPEYRKQGLGRMLYQRFEHHAVEHGCLRLKAITSPANTLSINFHRNIGMIPIGEMDPTGVPTIKDYAGPGKDRVVFIKIVGRATHDR